MSQKPIDTMSAGSPLDYAIEGVSELSSRQRRANESLALPIQNEYNASIADETADTVERLYTAVDGRALVEAAQKIGLDEMDEYESILSGCDSDDDADATLGRVMQELDQKLTYGLAPREKDASKVSTKKQRESVYIPHLINNLGDGGTIYMAKTLSTVAKVRIAWDLHDENEVVVVDDYEKWENLLGWEKLKKFPHGKNQIRKQLGDKLSDDVLDIVAGNDAGDDETKSDSDTSSRGRRTRTKPTDEILNVARSSSHSSRFKNQAKQIKESFEDDGYIGSSAYKVKQLILFPTTTDLNLSDHYWVAGKRWDDGGYAAVANCNKGTFEYLNDCDSVWHIEDYLEQADDYEFQTNHGPVTMGTIDESNLVLHLVPEQTRHRLMQSTAIEHLPSVLPEYTDNNLYRAPELPHADDMLYAPITKEELFWLRPSVLEMNSSDGDTGVLFYATSTPRDVGKKWNLSSDYNLYARARLHEWDFDCTELQTLDGCSYSLELDSGGFEVVETLAKLHDNGMNPFSETPQARWTQ